MTIEERAEIRKQKLVSGGNSVLVAVADKYGYIAGATEQKQIDVEKACEWLKDNLPTQDAAHYNYNYEEMFNDFVEDFRKAMEE